MPRAAKHCGIDGCMTLVPGGKHCPKHQHRFRNGGMTRTSTKEHRAWAAAVLRRDRRLCQLQIPRVCTYTATEADHIIPVSEGGAPFDLANGRAVCKECHKRKSSREGHKAAGHEVIPF